MAIQSRRGYEEDFDPEKMLPGEWAVSLDTKYVRMCFAPGECLRMATYEAFEQDMEQIQTILAECQNIQDAVEQIQQNIENAVIVIENYVAFAKTYSETASNEADRAASEADRAASEASKYTEILDMLEWKLLGTATGSNAISLTDVDYRELLVEVTYNSQVHTFYIPEASVTSTGKAYVNSTANMNGTNTPWMVDVRVTVTSEKVYNSLTMANIGNATRTAVTEECTTTVYYR